MSDEQGSDEPPQAPFRYHLELTPVQLKITHTALRSLLDDFGHDQSQVHRVIHEVLAKLPDEHAIRAIQLDRELGREAAELEGGGDPPAELPSRPRDEDPPRGGPPTAA